MSYKNDSELVILNKYSKASSAAKADLYETYDRLRDLTVSGPMMGTGGGVGKFGGVLLNIARIFSPSSFMPTFGNESIGIPGTSYAQPFSGGTGITTGGQAAFGLGPLSQFGGFPSGGAAPIDGGSPLAQLSSLGVGSILGAGLGFSGIGDGTGITADNFVGGLPGGVIAGGAFPVQTVGNAGGAAAGVAAGAGFGRNWVMPTAGIVSGVGGLLTTLGPFFGPFGLAAAAGGTVMSGVAGSVLQSFQAVQQRILANADTILTNKIKNLETTVKQLDAQSTILRKLLKESVEGDRKALDNL